MTILNTSRPAANHRITHLDVTSDCLADRGGLAPLRRFLDQSGLVASISDQMKSLRTGTKGIAVADAVRQILAFFFEGGSRHLTHFDHLPQDPGYAAVLETPASRLASSHQIKRMFAKIPKVIGVKFRAILRQMFAARLKREQPAMVELFLDTMVLDNDDANQRQGCQATNKKVKGFQPLQLSWRGQIVDAQFRGGSKHGNRKCPINRIFCGDGRAGILWMS